MLDPPCEIADPVPNAAVHLWFSPISPTAGGSSAHGRPLV